MGKKARFIGGIIRRISEKREERRGRKFRQMAIEEAARVELGRRGYPTPASNYSLDELAEYIRYKSRYKSEEGRE